MKKSTRRGNRHRWSNLPSRPEDLFEALTGEEQLVFETLDAGMPKIGTQKGDVDRARIAYESLSATDWEALADKYDDAMHRIVANVNSYRAHRMPSQWDTPVQDFWYWVAVRNADEELPLFRPPRGTAKRKRRK